MQDSLQTALTATRLNRYLLAHGISTFIIVAILQSAWMAVWDSFGGIVALIADLPILYLAGTGVAALYARHKLVRGQHDAPRWIRWAMGLSLPTSLFIGLFAAALTISSLAAEEFLYALVYVPFAVIGLGSLFVLSRVLFRTDLDELLWAGAAKPLDPALRFNEDEDVVLDLSDKSAANQETAQEAPNSKYL